jgi:Lipid A 3-O-deacylase (PagL)
MKICIIPVLVIVALLRFSLFASDISEANAHKSPVTTYSGGVGFGAVTAVNDELREYSENFLKISVVNLLYFRDKVSFFFDLNWCAPGMNFGGDVGVDFFMTTSDIRPFVGAGIGAAYLDKSNEFGDNFGISGTIHAGCIFDISDNLSIRFRVPVTGINNDTKDITIGADVGFIISDKFKRVRKLDYNR